MLGQRGLLGDLGKDPIEETSVSNRLFLYVCIGRPGTVSLPPPIRDRICGVWCNLLAIAEEGVLLLANLDRGTAVLLKSALASIFFSSSLFIQKPMHACVASGCYGQITSICDRPSALHRHCM